MRNAEAVEAGGAIEAGAGIEIHLTKEQKASIGVATRDRKVRMVNENPKAIVLAPKTREGHMTVKMLFGFDRAVNTIRQKAGTGIALEKVAGYIHAAQEFTDRCTQLSLSLSDGNGNQSFHQYETPEQRMAQALKRSSYVIDPRTEEGRKMAMLIKRIDPLLVQYRATCMDFMQGAAAIMNVLKLVGDFNTLTKTLSAAAKTEYVEPKGIKILLAALTPAV